MSVVCKLVVLIQIENLQIEAAIELHFHDRGHCYAQWIRLLHLINYHATVTNGRLSI